MKKEKNNFGFIAASSICIFLLLIMIVGNFGGKGTRADGADIKINVFGASYTCNSQESQFHKSGEIPTIFEQEDSCNVFIGDSYIACSRVDCYQTEDGCIEGLSVKHYKGCKLDENDKLNENDKLDEDGLYCLSSAPDGVSNNDGCDKNWLCIDSQGKWQNKGCASCKNNANVTSTYTVTSIDGSHEYTGVNCAVTTNDCSIDFTNAKSEIETGKSFTVTANVTPVSGAKVSKYSWSVSSNNVSITSGSSAQLATFKAGNSVGNATITLTATLDNDKTCSKSFSTNVVASTGGSSSSSNVGSKLTVSFKNGDDTVETKTCTVTSNTLGCVGVVTPAAPQAKDGYRFNGWGTSKGCTSGIFAANYAMSSITKNMTYYACFVEDKDKVDSSYKVDKCSFSGPYTVSSLVPDYAGCKHYGVYYDGKQEFAYVKQCCTDKGYIWVGENFSTAKSAYCITCSSDNGGNNGGNNNVDNDTGSDNGGNNGGNNNATNNPQTGSALIFVVWSIGIAMIVYAFWYFKTSKEY